MNKNKRMLMNSSKLVGIVKGYKRVKEEIKKREEAFHKTMAGFNIAAEILSNKLTEFMKSLGMKSFIEPVSGIQVYRKEDSIYYYDIPRIREVLESKADDILLVDDDKFDALIGDYPELALCREKLEDRSSVVIIVEPKKESTGGV